MFALALAGCQGGGSNPPPFNSGNPSPTSATSSGSVSPSGGSVSTTLGTQTVKVVVPPGALSGPATVTVTVYSNGGAPKPLSAGRKVQTIGDSPVLLVEFSVAISGATLLKPLQASLVTPPAVSGSVFRLAGYGTAFDDVDTVTFAGGTATSDLNIVYPRMSLATPPGGTLYAFYTTSGPKAAPVPVISVTNPSGNPVGMFGSTTFAASEASPNGFPYLDTTFTFALDNSSLGTINASTGAFTAGPVDGAGNITATDTTAGRGNPHGSGQVTVSSQRPGGAGDSFTFAGQLSSTTQLVNRNATQPQTDTANVALTTTVASVTHQSGGGVSGFTNVMNSTETDAYPLQTITTKSLSSMGWTDPAGGRSTVLYLGSQATDSNGSTYTTQYDVAHGNGIIDVLPETTGPFGPNTAALTYNEDDPAHFHRDRTVAANGAYVEHGTDAFNDVQTITVNSDLSASYDARQYSGLAFTMTAPSGSTTPKNIVLRVFNSSGTQIAAFNVPSWIPASMTQPSTETDADNGSKPYPAACNVPSKYGTSGNQIVQTINRADPALGNLETQVTTTYVAPRVGPVCIQMTDSVKTFYDYTLQNGFSLLVSGGTAELEDTNISETLTLQSASTEGGTHATSVTRGTASASGTAFAAVSFARARFEHNVREKLGGMRKATFNRNFGSHGVTVQ